MVELKTLEANEEFRQKTEKFMEDAHNRFLHLESIGTPEWYERGLEECKDFVTQLQGELKVLENQVKNWMDSFQTETIGLWEAQHWMKVSACTHQELTEVLHTDVSNISKILNGKKVREDSNDYAKVKTYCLQKMARDQKIDNKKYQRESYLRK